MHKLAYSICLAVAVAGITCAQPTEVRSKLVHSNGTIYATKNTCVRGKQRSKRLVGGTPAKLGDWPWVASLGYNDSRNSYIKWLCAGSLITNKHVLTAANCLNNIGTRQLTTVRLGDLDLNPAIADGAKALDVPVERFISHAEYDKRTINNNIAVVILKDTVTFSEYIKPICLPTKDMGWEDVSFEGTELYIAGWGRTNVDKYTDGVNSALMEVKVPVVGSEQCKQAYQNKATIFDSSVICAGAEGKDSCQGDSGGPLMYKKDDQYFVVGIVSHGFFECGKANAPGVYTYVIHYIDWILKRLE